MNGITASESPTLMNANPYQTKEQLMQIKLGKIPEPDLSEKPSVKKGILFEPHIRNMLELSCGKLKDICAESKLNPMIKASFDGMDNLNRPHEIKCVGKNNWDWITNNGIESTAYKMYHWQVIHQCLTSNTQRGFLHICCPPDPTENNPPQEIMKTTPILTFTITPTPQELSTLMDNIFRFWQKIQSEKSQ